MKRIASLTVYLCLPVILFAQQVSSPGEEDSTHTKTLQEVMVKAYEQNRRLAEVPAAIGLVGQKQLNRFNNAGILPAINTIPGVRMEERSPGSYRLNFRGSSLRSPFGVRDVKVYYNEIPLTDPGGNTYLNQLGFYSFQSIEIIKGPAGSLYGAGIGGALLIHSLPAVWRPGVSVDYIGGSFTSNNLNANIRAGEEDRQNNFSYSHQTSDGYRVQTKMRRDLVNWETQLKANEKQTIHAFMMYSDLYYQTPGALTKTEYALNPQAARPASGPAPGAVQNKAAIYQKIFTTGISSEYQFNDSWQNSSSVYGAYTDFSNPGIRVYEKRKEPHFGGRTVFRFKKQISTTTLQFHFGAEGQKGFFNTKDYKNKLGATDSLQTDDEVSNGQYMIFAQGDINFRSGWIFTVGGSFNKSSIQFTRVSVLPPLFQSRTFENKLAPRVAILKKILPEVSLYASAARGFSNPTVSELLKSSGTIGGNLQPEDGIDYEFGARGALFGDKFYFDVNAFFFHLDNTIVQRIDTNGVSYSINAGSTKQHGLETFVSYQLADHPAQFFSDAKIWISHSWHDFHYNSFKQVNSDYSGKQLPSVPPNTIVAGLDIFTKPGLYANITYTYCDAIPLNDANTDFASSYNLLGARAGFRKTFGGRIRLEIFGGVDNLFNTKYSLGNDINAAAGRYYNAAPGINYYAGISLNYLSH
jgi:iron complex outermembrane receptor protein